MTGMRRIVRDEPSRVQLVEDLAADGFVVHGLMPPEEPFDLAAGRVLCTGTATATADIEAVLLATARGAAVVVVDALTDPLDSADLADAIVAFDSPAEPAGPSPRPEIDDVTAQLLRALSGGSSIPAAARAGHLSLRTANRRLAAARAHYGVATTHEAVLTHLRSAGGG